MSEASVAAAQKCLDDFLSAFNARDVEAFEETFNFPSVRLGPHGLAIIQKGEQGGMFSHPTLAEWHHSVWARREVIHAGDNKVHVALRGVRYRADGSELTAFDTFYVITCENGHWGVKARSSFAPG